MGIRDKPIAPRSPWQNGFAERLIGSIRRECLDQIIVCGEEHLRRTLLSYASYYNRARTHRSLNKDAPVHRPIQRLGALRSHPVSRWTTSPIRPNLVFGTDKYAFGTERERLIIIALYGDCECIRSRLFLRRRALTSQRDLQELVAMGMFLAA